MASQIVEEILKQSSEKEEKFLKSVTVEKQLELDLDLGHLLASDPNAIDHKELKSDKEEYLKKLSRDNTQIMINKLWQLETSHVDNLVVVKLPAPKTVVPRAKPLPKPKQPTKWELFAKEKGIKKRKREKLVWDEGTKEWKPRFGYRGINQKNNWLIEVPDNADPNADFFAKEKEERSERIAKNEFQRLRNIARNNKIKSVSVGGVLPEQNLRSKEQLIRESSLAKMSTASLGKFTESLPTEKRVKNSGKKRKFESNFGDLKMEKEKNLKIVEELAKKKPKLDVDKAVQNVESKRRIQNNKDLKNKKNQGKTKQKSKQFKNKSDKKRANKFKSSKNKPKNK